MARSLIVGLLIGGACLWFVAREARLQDLVLALQDVRWTLAPVFIAVLLLFYWLRAARWGLLLQPYRRLSASVLFPSVMIAYAGNTLLPLQLGELIRVYIVSKRHDIAQSSLATSIVLERLFDVAGLLIIIAVSPLVRERTPPIMLAAARALSWIAFATLVLIVTYVFFTPVVLRVATKVTARLPERLRRRIIRIIENGAVGLEALRRPRLLLAALGMSILQWGLMGICVWLSVVALSLDVPLAAAAVLLVFVVVAVTIPSSPGYIGSIQLAFALALTPFAVSVESALAASVFYHLLACVTVILLGAVYAWRLGVPLMWPSSSLRLP